MLFYKADIREILYRIEIFFIVCVFGGGSINIGFFW